MKATSKKELRNLLKESRKEFHLSEERELADREITKKLLAFLEKHNFRKILCYLSASTEVSTWKLLEVCCQNGYEVYIPKVEGKHMEFYPIKDLKQDVHLGSFAIYEPMVNTSCVSPSSKDFCVIIPGLGFDTQGNRIGYGGGFYDRYLERYPHCLRIALLYHCQLQEEVIVEPTDQRCQILITEKEILHVTKNW